MAEPTYFGAHLAQGAPHHPAGPVAIVGGGLVGMVLALALKHQGIAAVLHDARPRGAARSDPRVLALSHGSQQIFTRLGLWPHIAAAATPITTIHVSQRGRFGRTRMTAQEQNVPALGQVTAAGHIAAALDDALAAAGIEYHDHAHIDHVNTTKEQACLHRADDTHSTAPLVIYAEGATKAANATDATNATVARLAAEVRDHDYDQHALICQVTTTTPHGHVAHERFTPDGPLALLPFDQASAGNGYSMVYTCAPEEAQRLAALDEAAFLKALQAHFGSTRLCFATASPRHVFPLGLRYRSAPVAPRCVWLGNAAQTLHPVAGQGFNLALRDVMALVHVLAQDDARQDPGNPQVLARYAAGRRHDRLGMIGITHGLVRLFSNDLPILRETRGLALLALDLSPTLRSLLAQHMMYGARSR